jgi:hypothetical protein
MADFVFKNLAVKLLPADAGDDALRAFEACTEPPECGTCTEITCQGCTSPSDQCGACTDCTGVTEPCGSCTVVTEVECHVCTCIQHTEVPIVSAPDEFGDPGDVRAELEAHKAHLRDSLAQTARAERRPQSLAEVDELRAQLEQALAELEERRAVLAKRPQPGDR